MKKNRLKYFDREREELIKRVLNMEEGGREGDRRKKKTG